MSEAIEYAKEWHRARIGTREPALCGALPPGEREWLPQPGDLPPCKECEKRYVVRGLWLAA
jgi:hypothetical protein